ncbi:SCO1860 family LAETG-anchored protein [Streptomyces yaanensis]|uniref:SCO1860 family LAETG-anchored protein n=1 Tax=Streptomyces yaanensis TaxID=1142239 RepID=A0ABV7SLG9_9ACTN|nr:SCO1860 family LAETG-anchored protein [Streptomyces sp. CGMCC 4.7035]WNC01103.1 SCO1860 family LAETG-anchored protein [Streptomyces sp. CGMCC 4.7035]
MNGTTFRMPARRLTTVAVATALAAGPAALAGAGSARATTDHGRATAVVLRTGLDVSLLNKTVNVPLTVSLNEVQAPRSANRTALTASLDGVNGGRPFTVLRAETATAKATVTATRAEASTNLAHARVHVPGLPLLSLIEVEGVTSRAVCEAGRKPVATANLLGGVTIFGRKVTVSAGGPTEVKVPGVGEVRLDVSPTRTTSRTAAASALRLTVSVNPLKLNVAEVTGTVTLAGVTCETPVPAASAGPSSGASSGASAAGDSVDGRADGRAGGVRPQGAHAETGLAETGGSSAMPYIVGGAVALLVAGGGAVGMARRRRG